MGPIRYFSELKMRAEQQRKDEYVEALGEEAAECFYKTWRIATGITVWTFGLSVASVGLYQNANGTSIPLSVATAIGIVVFLLNTRYWISLVQDIVLKFSKLICR